LSPSVPSSAIAQVLQTGLKFHQAGQLAFAEACYRKILQVDPRNASALHLLGRIAQHAGKCAAGIQLIAAAIRLDPENAGYHLDLGSIYCRLANRDIGAGNPQNAAADVHTASLPPELAGSISPLAPLDAAVECYRRALELKPDYAEAHYNLGNVLLWQGKLPEASECYRCALALDPSQAQFHYRLGDVHFRLGRWTEASECYQRVVELLPKCAEVHYKLGNVRLRQGDLEEASASFRRTLELKPYLLEAHASLADVLSRQGRVAEAQATYQHAIAANPNSGATYTYLAATLKSQGDFVGAEDACRRALAAQPGLADAHSNLGTILLDQGKLVEAAKCFRRALALDSKCVAAYGNLAGVLWRQGDLEGAIASCRRALALDPNYASAYCNLGTTLADQGDLVGALECYQRDLALRPGSVCAVYYSGLAHLQLGDFAQGWREYEFRWQTKSLPRGPSTFSQPLWRGQDLKGERILLYFEQGLGDTLQFVRYVPLVAGRGGEVILEVPAGLHRLLTGLKGVSKIVDRGEAVPDFSWQCPLLSLPLAFATELATIPADIPYLQANLADVQAWSQRLQGEGLRVGLAWTGNPNHVRNRQRSMTLDQLTPLTRVEGVTFYSLQKGLAAASAQPLPAGMRLIDLDAQQNDFADTAAIVANLDLVISVDTSVAHLAGAMGKPVWIPLHHMPDWRWLLHRTDSPWYPTARLFRQSTPGDWTTVVSELVHELHKAAVGSRSSVVGQESATSNKPQAASENQETEESSGQWLVASGQQN
jgi:tetratricopeptide (TPR) repeat protein